MSGAADAAYAGTGISTQYPSRSAARYDSSAKINGESMSWRDTQCEPSNNPEPGESLHAGLNGAEGSLVFLEPQCFIVDPTVSPNLQTLEEEMRVALASIKGAVLVVLGPPTVLSAELMDMATRTGAAFLHLQTEVATVAVVFAIPAVQLIRINPYFDEMHVESAGGSASVNDFIAEYVASSLFSPPGPFPKSSAIGICARNHLAELVVTSLNAEAAEREDDSKWSTIMLRRRVQDHILANLFEPNLAPDKIAADCGISTSYLHKLFRCTGTSVCRWILENRLQICCARLQDPSYRHLSISRIAYDVGFNSPAHFSTRFKQHFGVTPGELRANHSGVATSAHSTWGNRAANSGKEPRSLTPHSAAAS